METGNKKACRVAVDGHVLLQKEKTGVGWTARYLIDELARDKDMDVQINFVDFMGYRCHKLIKHYKKQGCRVKLCWWLPYSLYYRAFNALRLPYFLLFGRKNDITLFFEYYVPYKVGTKAASYVYDVNYKVYPETVEAGKLGELEKNLPVYCGRADIIITISEFSKREIEKYLGIDSSRIRVVPCGVDYEKYSRAAGQNQMNAVREKYGIDGDYILYMGTLEPRKNIAVLIEAYYELAKRRRRLPKLVIAGKKGWMYEPLFRMVSDFRLGEEVIFPGYIEEQDCPALMAGAELFVFPSLYEGFGIPPLEAMACGTPVIASDAASLPEVVGDSGVLFRPKDADDLAGKLGWLIGSREERERLSALGRERAKKYTWQTAGEKLAAILKTA